MSMSATPASPLPLRVLSVCSGAGGLDIGLEAAGATVVGLCEIHPPARAVLAHRWPTVPLWDDLTTLNGARASIGGTAQSAVLTTALRVRRLLPVECERLMGWPDDWTRYGPDGTEIADSHRYAMCGNGVVAPQAAWIGRRLIAAHRGGHS